MDPWLMIVAALRVDPHEEALARQAMGDEEVDQALALLDGMPVIEERLPRDVQQIVDEASARRAADAA